MCVTQANQAREKSPKMKCGITEGRVRRVKRPRGERNGTTFVSDEL